MSVVPMARLTALVLDRHAPSVIAELAALGEAEFLPPQAVPERQDDGLSPVDTSAMLARVSGLAKRARDLCVALGVTSRIDGQVSLLGDNSELDHCEQQIRTAEEALRAVEESLALVAARTKNLQSMRDNLVALRGVSTDVALLRSLSFLTISHVQLPAENYLRLTKALADQPVLVMPLASEEGRSVALLAYPRSASTSVDSALSTLLADKATLPEGISGVPTEALRQVEDELGALELERRRLFITREEIGLRHRRCLSLLAPQLRATQLAADLQRLTAGSGRARVASAFVPLASAEAAKAAIERVTHGAAVVRIEPLIPGAQNNGHASHGEAGAHASEGPRAGAHEALAEPKIPTKLKNHPWLEPFEALVAMYGRPAYGEIDPTPLVALSFVTMFGMMFGDLGQGAVLFALGWLLRWRVPSLKSASLIVRLCAASSMIFGCMYGDLFGSHFMHPLWLKPMEDTMRFLKLTAIFGVGLMTIGLLLNLANTIRNKEWGELLFGKNGLAGIWFYWGTLVCFLVLSVPVTLTAAAIVWVVPSLLMFFREPLWHALSKQRHKGGPLGEFVVGAFFELFETVIGYLSNTISFVRLAAFALNHAGLFTVVFLLAKMVDAGAADGWVDGIILVAGNIFIIGLEGLVVTIQTLRLQYYELFSKFYRGTGVPFRPASLNEDAQ